MIYTYTRKMIAQIIDRIVVPMKDDCPIMHEKICELVGSLSDDEWDHLAYMAERYGSTDETKKYRIVFNELKRFAIARNYGSNIIRFWPSIAMVRVVESSDTDDEL